MIIGLPGTGTTTIATTTTGTLASDLLVPADVLATTASLAVSPSPSPDQQEELDATTVTPGLLGFLVTFALVLACIPLFRSMTTKLRRVERRAEDEPAEPTSAGADDLSPGPDETR